MENVPVHGTEATAGRRAGLEQPKSSSKKSGSKKSKLKLIGVSSAVVVVIAIIVLAGLFIYRASTGSTIDSAKFQAVFFTNGQVYFGRLQTLNDSYLKLTDIFYLQTKSTDSTNPQSTTSSTSSDVELVKLGDEIHGPEDSMIINKDQLLFFENLKADGKVTQSILNFKKQ